MTRAVLASIISIVLSLITFLLVFWYGDLLASELDMGKDALSLTLTFFVFVLADRISIAWIHDSDRKKILEATNTMEKNSKIAYRISRSMNLLNFVDDKTEDIFEQVRECALNSDKVLNTFVSIGGVGLESEIFKDLYSAYFDLDPKRQWYDLVSLTELYQERFKLSLNPQIVGRRHSIFVIKHNIPIVNFMICFQGSTATDVFFGWVYDEVDAAHTVLHSEDPSIISIFQRHWDVLVQNKLLDNCRIPVDYGKSLNERFSDLAVINKVGYWFTCAFDKSKAIQGDALIIESFGLIEILIEDRHLCVSGKIYFPDLSEKNEVRTNPRRVYQTTNKLYFEYDFDAGRNREGFCVYRFSYEALNNSKSQRIDTIDGFL